MTQQKKPPQTYSIVVTNAATRDLKRLQRRDLVKVDARIRTLATDPRPKDCKKLADNIYRIRVGSYRIVYGIEDDKLVVVIIRVRDRKNVYRNLPAWKSILDKLNPAS